MKPRTKSSFRGVFVALVTPMKSHGEIDFKKLASRVDAMIDAGIHGLIPMGSTGEFYALTRDERRAVIRATLEAAKGRIPVVAGTNASSTREVVACSREAEELGCDGVMLAPPYYSLPTPGELFEHFKAVNHAIGIPIMLYNYPGRTGLDMQPEFIKRLAGLRNVRYIKESTGDTTRISELLHTCGDRIGVFAGGDSVAFESLVLGAVGWVGGIANVIPREHVELYELIAERGDIAAARKLFYRILPILALIEGGGKYTQWVKAACAAGPPRPPLRGATAAELLELRTLLAALRERKTGPKAGQAA